MAKFDDLSIVAANPHRDQKGPNATRIWPTNRNISQWWSRRPANRNANAIANAAAERAYLVARVGLAYCASMLAILALALASLALASGR